MLPNFLCIGAPKSGTTTLYEILKQHPEIGVSSFKEPRFFDNEDNWKKGIDWYEKTYFSHIVNEVVLGEFTPSYLANEVASKRIFNSLGEGLKLVLVLRNPIERAYSHYLHSKRDSYEELSFLEALKQEQSRLLVDKEDPNKFGYIFYGRYSEQVKSYLSLYDRKQLNIIIFEEFLKDKRSTISTLLDFLGVERQQLNTNIHKNPARTARFPILKRAMKKDSVIKKFVKFLVPSSVSRQKARNYLHGINNKQATKVPLSNEEFSECYNLYFKVEIESLENLLSLDLSDWKRC